MKLTGVIALVLLSLLSSAHAEGYVGFTDLYNQLTDYFADSVKVAMVGGLIIGLMLRVKS